jgi:hypothetical protein
MRRFAFLAGLLFFTVTLSGCDILIQEALNATQSLAESDDPGVRAAGDSREAVRIEKEARQHFTEGRETQDPVEIAKAVQLRPFDIRYRAYQVALLSAYSKNLEMRSQRGQALGEALGVLGYATDSGKAGENEELYFVSNYLPALQDLAGRFDENSSEAQQLQHEACSVLDILHHWENSLAQRILEDNPYDWKCP